MPVDSTYFRMTKRHDHGQQVPKAMDQDQTYAPWRAGKASTITGAPVDEIATSWVYSLLVGCCGFISMQITNYIYWGSP